MANKSFESFLNRKRKFVLVGGESGHGLSEI